ncbi:hypothetical protein [Geothrix sp.]|jgi:hypothetical protein|uniref:hypothetical protein n=1 Tax=Geothrix sp. TaxID=1962974 RepID=UPI0025C4EF34|nr:hypothetical protein [Geothrix sp.]
MRGIASVLSLGLGLGLTVGCSVTGKLYPVQTAPVPAPGASSQPLIAKVAFVGLGKSGTISVPLATGEVCMGPYSFIEPNPATLDKNTLSAAWDQVYGPGYYVAHVLGMYHAVTELRGSQGTILWMDFYRTPGEGRGSQILGVAKDNRSNLYKLVF